MKPIEAHKQVALGPMRCVQLALTGMSYRMFRSLITVAILALAVAFLVHMFAYGLLSDSVEVSAYEELRSDREAGEAVSRLAGPDNAKGIISVLAEGRDEDRLSEYQTWSGLDEQQFSHVMEAAEQFKQFSGYLDKLPPASHAAVVGVYTPGQLLDRILDPQQFQRFQQTITDLSLPAPLGGWDSMRRLADEQWPLVKETAAAIRAGHKGAIADVRAQFPDHTVAGLFRGSPAGLGPALREVGFAIPDDELREISDFVVRADDLQAVSDMITDEDVRSALKQRLRIEKEDVSSEAALQYVNSQSRAQWFADVLADNGAPASLTPDRLSELAEGYRRRLQLERAAGDEPPEIGAGLFGLPLSTLYLIGLSFLVCIVGVANAMLMSVTERFTEIATMKCLGAMDRFVMMMFVFEAAIQGVVGGIAGLVLGVLLAVLRGLIDYGTLLQAAAGVTSEIVLASLLSLGIGVVLATVAAVGPSWVAARLAPMEAMRVE